MPVDDMVNDVGAFGGLPFFVVMSLLFASVTGDFLPVLLAMLGGLGACYAITAIIRWFHFIPRPQPLEHNAWWQRLDAGSFPSLHAMRVAFLSVVVVILMRFDPLVIVIVTLLTVAVCWARVRKKCHRLADVIVGAIIGIAIALLAMVLMVAVPYWF